jgi:hypothetical protein
MYIKAADQTDTSHDIEAVKGDNWSEHVPLS